MLTANAMEEHLRLAIGAGADHHIAKPITPESLFAGIADALAAASLEEARGLSAARLSRAAEARSGD